jgi:hypothetical protein
VALNLGRTKIKRTNKALDVLPTGIILINGTIEIEQT